MIPTAKLFWKTGMDDKASKENATLLEEIQKTAVKKADTIMKRISEEAKKRVQKLLQSRNIS